MKGKRKRIFLSLKGSTQFLPGTLNPCAKKAEVGWSCDEICIHSWREIYRHELYTKTCSLYRSQMFTHIHTHLDVYSPNMYIHKYIYESINWHACEYEWPLYLKWVLNIWLKWPKVRLQLCQPQYMSTASIDIDWIYLDPCYYYWIMYFIKMLIRKYMF